ncbi:diaminopropionate ammonia-lyase [Alcaligenes endophyticus]|uniref:Diaminopropionate ammonia-lyase n=1 Tax=Alcaligenes endophyticus TaxID=1929088 RepID=A0ABT8EMR2_9BURK|nr:diaminopropionate ammonia-lyase [Alcaligenes endophyticus]MCX5590953.1 diaminopropionate ammonia-lyase [Alcaligenes endophyticus]MDN4122470.1 diaminopropionate ammonia-lyase [Alcaligenes endophyticus]
MPKNSTFYLEAYHRTPEQAQLVQATAELTLPAALCKQAQAAIVQWQHYQPTAMHELNHLAKHYGLASLHCKDEGTRFGLGSFKALGGAYAVSLFAKTAGQTVACATEGNHGRSVAWGAQRAGVDCVIFLHEGVSTAREEAISRYGARIIRVPGTYDDAVRECARLSAQEQWQIISDTSWGDYQDIPKFVMAGYSIMAEEIQAQLSAPPTHVFLQGGVGGLAAAMMACLGRAWPEAAICYIVVEPRYAACLQASARAEGQYRSTPGPFHTVLAGLACGEPSTAVLPLIYQRSQLYLALDDEAIKQAMIQYARPLADDPRIIAGASGAAGLAGLLVLQGVCELKKQVNLDKHSRVLVINTENDTDPAAYRAMIG